MEIRKKNLSPSAYVVQTTVKHVIHVVERTRTAAKCRKMNSARAKRAKLLFFTVKCANL